MFIKQKNCFMANLCQVLEHKSVSVQDLFWALIDIDEVNYKKYTLDWLSCYLTELGIYSDSLWTASLASNFEDLQQKIMNEEDNTQLIVVPIKNVAYRCDLVSQMHQNEGHVLLIHKDKAMFLEDRAIGATGKFHPKTRLNKNQFIFPFTFCTFNIATFMNQLFSIDVPEKTREYAHNLINRSAQTQDFKRQLLTSTVLKNDLNGLARTNLYEESYYYRAFFTFQKSSMLQEHYQRLLSKFKATFLRMQHSVSSIDLLHLQNTAVNHINQLGELDHAFYQAFAQTI